MARAIEAAFPQGSCGILRGNCGNCEVYLEIEANSCRCTKCRMKEGRKNHQTVLGVGEANLSGRGKLKKKKEVSKEQEGDVGWTSIHVHRILPR